MSLIDRGQVMTDYLKNLGSKDSYKAKYEALVKTVDEAAAVDAIPVQHGRWERMDEYCNHSKTFRCSACKGDVEYSHFTRFCEYDYCPNCGAKMSDDE